MELHVYYRTGYWIVNLFTRKLAVIETGTGSKLLKLILGYRQSAALELDGGAKVACSLSERIFHPIGRVAHRSSGSCGTSSSAVLVYTLSMKKAMIPKIALPKTVKKEILLPILLVRVALSSPAVERHLRRGFPLRFFGNCSSKRMISP